jgi:predicted GTPase
MLDNSSRTLEGAADTADTLDLVVTNTLRMSGLSVSDTMRIIVLSQSVGIRAAAGGAVRTAGQRNRQSIAVTLDGRRMGKTRTSRAVVHERSVVLRVW